jgi:DNA adenine methylase
MTTSAEPPRCTVRYNSPLRYPGGKAKLADFIKAMFRANDLLDGVYLEPYAGGASVALTLLFEECVSEVYINDLDRAVFAFWHSVIHEPERLCRLVRDARVTPNEWARQRRVYRATTASLLDLGFAAFFLNRTNRSGIIGSAGMIGGARQRGRWKLDARYNGPELAERIGRVARYRDRIRIFNLDAIDFLLHCARLGLVRALAYLDPPYYGKGRRRLYANYYDDVAHAEIAKLLPDLPFPWVVSYDDAPQIRRLYRGYRRTSYSLRYTAAQCRSGAEVIFVSAGLVVPRGMGRRSSGLLLPSF